MADDRQVEVGDEVQFMLRQQFRFGIVQEVQPRKKRARIKFGEGKRWIPLDDLVVRRKLSQPTDTSPSPSDSTQPTKNSRKSEAKSATRSSTKSQQKTGASSRRRTRKTNSTRSTSTGTQK